MNQIHATGVIATDIRIDEYPAKNGEPGEIKVKASFILASRRPGAKPAPGERAPADLIRVETWGGQARNLAQYNGKGSRIGVTGHIRSEFYNPDGTQKGGELRSCVVADRIEYLTPRPQTDPAAPPVAESEPVAKVARR